MTSSFTYLFEEVPVVVDGRGKLATGEIEVTYNRYVDDYYGVCFETYTAPYMTVTDLIDDETEEGVACPFELTHKMATYQAILTAIDKSRYTLEDAASADYNWER